VNSFKKLGLMIALALSAAAVFASAEVSTMDNKPKTKKQHSKKHLLKGKKTVKKATASKRSVKKSASGETAKLQTDINFNDSVLRGRYQTPDEATAKVENEKSLADLLAVRTQFKDRLRKASEQN